MDRWKSTARTRKKLSHGHGPWRKSEVRSSDMEQVRSEKIRDQKLRWTDGESQKRQKACARKAGRNRKRAKHSVFPMICVAPEGRKVGSLPRWVRRNLGKWDMRSCHSFVAQSTFGGKQNQSQSTPQTLPQTMLGPRPSDLVDLVT